MISVCMATYNGEKVVIRQLQSIINQLNPNDEIIVIDDASTDNTIAKINTLQDKRIKVFKNNKTLGPISSFERGLGKVSGDIIFLSDQDDIWLPDKVKSALNDFKRTNCQLWTHDAKVVDANLTLIDDSWNVNNHNRFTGSNLGTVLKNPYTGSMMAFTKKALHAALPFPKNITMHDQWLGMVAQKKNYIIFHSDKVLMEYIRYGNNVTARRKKKILWMMKTRFRMAVNIMKYVN